MTETLDQMIAYADLPSDWARLVDRQSGGG